MKDIRFTITVDGKDYPCRQTMGAAIDFYHFTGHDINDDDGTGAILMVYFCARSTALTEGRTLPWTPEVFPHVLSLDEAVGIIDTYAAAMAAAQEDDDDDDHHDEAQKKMTAASA